MIDYARLNQHRNRWSGRINQLLIAIARSDLAVLPMRSVALTGNVGEFPDEKLMVSALGGATTRYD